MDGRPTWTDCDEAGDYVVPNVLSPRDLVFRPDNMDETVPHTQLQKNQSLPQSEKLRPRISRCPDFLSPRFFNILLPNVLVSFFEGSQLVVKITNYYFMSFLVSMYKFLKLFNAFNICVIINCLIHHCMAYKHI